MPEFGFWELALLMLVALLVVGPQRLPRLAADIGGWVGRIKRMAQRFKADLSYELNANNNSIGQAQKEMDGVKKELRAANKSVSDTIRALDPMHDTIREQIDSGRYQGDDDKTDKNS